jgi:hypothetical protein
MKNLLHGLTVIAVVSSPVFASAAESVCKANSDEKSVFVRSLQTDLMVGALTCNSSDQYNSFIHQFSSVLKTDADHLRGYFKKRNGKAGPDELNTFVTHLANDESERSIQQGQTAYCDNTAKIFQTVLALPPAKIEDYATTLPISGEAPVRKCAVPAAAPVVAAPAAVTDSAEAPVQ